MIFFHVSFLVIFIFNFLSCNKDYSTVMDDFYMYVEDENLYLKVDDGTINKPGKFKIINKSDNDIYIHYIQYSFCSFFFMH